MRKRGIIIIKREKSATEEVDTTTDYYVHPAFTNESSIGYANGGWILLDYYDIIIHVFSEKERSFYDLDNIWRDGELLRLGEY